MENETGRLNVEAGQVPAANAPIQPQPMPMDPAFAGQPQPMFADPAMQPGAPVMPGYQPQPMPMDPAFAGQPQPMPMDPAFAGQPQPMPMDPAFAGQPQPAPKPPKVKKESTINVGKMIIGMIPAAAALILAAALAIVLLLNLNKENSDPATIAKHYIEAAVDGNYSKMYGMIDGQEKVSADSFASKMKSKFGSMGDSNVVITVSDPVYSDKDTKATVYYVINSDNLPVKTSTVKLVLKDGSWLVNYK